MPDTIVKLKKPIEHGGKIYDQVALREPTCREIKASARNTAMATKLALVATCSNVPQEVVDEMLASDMEQAWQAIEDFVRGGPSLAGASDLASQLRVS